MPALIRSFRNHVPIIAPNAFVAPGAVVIGDVEIGAGSSVWYGVIIRGDVNVVRIGERSNIQDGSVIHVSSRKQGTFIGNDVSIGHMALIHACTLQDGCFVGMKACVMDEAVVETGAMVAAGALVTPGKRVKSGELWAGAPARMVRLVSDEERQETARIATLYAALGAEHAAAHASTATLGS
ncbi:MAG: gamma carbonic anhydrase family protein [Alphaproteobacteria bacterium]|nr:gamma carbonic anhydrase family protein [Alphaproteobacteria bacterium]